MIFKKVKKRGFKKFFFENFKKSRIYLKKSKNYIWFISILFLITGLIGFFYPFFFEKEILNIIEGLVKETQGLGLWGLIKYIMFNNIKSAFSGIIFGFLLGIIPLSITIINGYILGFVANKSVSIDGFSILWKLIPHGIFEIPAILISVGLGLKIGMFIFTNKSKKINKEFLNWFLDSLRVFIFIIIPLLILAAIIEGSLIYFLD